MSQQSTPGPDHREEPTVRAPRQSAVGLPAVGHALHRAHTEMGPVRGARALLRVNQPGGFDCPGCAWPEPDRPHTAEFCEMGAKAVADEATRTRCGPAFFARHPIQELATASGHWLGRQGRLTRPMYRAADDDYYREIGWDDALVLLAEELRSLDSPDEAVFYTSGRTSNEAAFLYQLLARRFGTNNLPDCSNMCHESSGAALTETLGVGKGSVSLNDLHRADLIIVAGQNPGTNHPRMLSALERAKQSGARIITVNPLPEAALQRFRNPQTVRGLTGFGTDLTDLFLQVRLGGDQVLFRMLGRLLLEAAEADPSAGALDADFIDQHTDGFDAWATAARGLTWDTAARATGLDPTSIEAARDLLLASRRTVVCWAMGLTQHQHAVATIQEVVNLLLLRGDIGKPGAGVCPVRGHSNVQGDRTMGITERPDAGFLDALDHEFGITSPRAPGLDTVGAIRALRDRRARVFVGLGGNFAAATPDTAATEEALQRARLTVHISTKLNRSHCVTGTRALILPTLGRTERDIRDTGEQFVTVEDSMSTVHASQGRLAPADPELLSEVAIICRLARHTFGDSDTETAIPWEAFEHDYGTIRDRIARVIPGFADYSARATQPGGFTLPHAPRDERRFPTRTGRARFTAEAPQWPELPEGRLLLQTLRAHDQFNTTIYGQDDRYRGIRGGRRIVLVHPDDATDRGLADGDRADLTSEWVDGTERTARDFRVVHYPTARGCVAAYFPETNVLVPLDHTARKSNTPASKSVVVRLSPPAEPTPPTATER